MDKIDVKKEIYMDERLKEKSTLNVWLNQLKERIYV